MYEKRRMWRQLDEGLDDIVQKGYQAGTHPRFDLWAEKARFIYARRADCAPALASSSLSFC